VRRSAAAAKLGPSFHNNNHLAVWFHAIVTNALSASQWFSSLRQGCARGTRQRHSLLARVPARALKAASATPSTSRSHPSWFENRLPVLF
jgi:hypothetical protein